jgi:MoaA/NifB/PqqE/SkfB family radical SAM enzyme
MADGKERKRCSWIHDTLVINPRGEVSACCHQQPGVLGNIYENTLEEIFNGARLKEFRQQEIDGTLHCLEKCYIPQNPRVPDHVNGDYHSDLQNLLIEFGEFCNVSCVMCPQDHGSRLELDPAKLVKNIEIPKSCNRTWLWGGEPLVLKSARDYFEHCIANGIKVNILTNGTAMSEQMAAKIAVHCGIIRFSINAATREIHEIVNVGSQFDRVLRNIGRVVQAKQELNGNVVIVGHMTLVKQNIHEIPLFIRKREELGFEYLDFNFDAKIVPRLLSEDPEMRKRLASEIQAAIEEDTRIPPTPAPNQLPRIDASGLRVLGLSPARAPCRP